MTIGGIHINASDIHTFLEKDVYDEDLLEWKYMIVINGNQVVRCETSIARQTIVDKMVADIKLEKDEEMKRFLEEVMKKGRK